MAKLERKRTNLKRNGFAWRSLDRRYPLTPGSRNFSSASLGFRVLGVFTRGKKRLRQEGWADKGPAARPAVRRIVPGSVISRASQVVRSRINPRDVVRSRYCAARSADSATHYRRLCVARRNARRKKRKYFLLSDARRPANLNLTDPAAPRVIVGANKHATCRFIAQDYSPRRENRAEKPVHEGSASNNGIIARWTIWILFYVESSNQQGSFATLPLTS